jgi:hypothetical protein
MCGAAMTTPDEFRSYASQLLAMAAKAREDGDDNYADRLTGRANELLDWANKDEQPAAMRPPTAMPKPRRE